MGDHITRRTFLGGVGVAGTIAAAGCTDLTLATDSGESVSVGEEVDTVTFSGGRPAPEGSSNAPPLGDRTLPLPVPPAEMAQEATDGGPSKDGIPSIDEPSFVSLDAASGLNDGSTVFGVERDGEAKAYPRRILVSHEVVNDTIGGDPVSVTYCPLTGTAQGFERGTTTFGVSGMLVNNNLIMYDRERQRWWPQVGAVSIPSRWADTEGGATLREFEVVRTTLGQWRELHPETVVLSTETGYARNYDRDPYGARGYYEDDDTIFGNIYENDHFHAKQWLYGARTAEGAIAFTRNLVHDDGLVEAELGGTPVLAVHDERLDTAWMYWNPDEEAFSHDGETISGPDGTEYAPDDLPLEGIISFDAYWFAWIAYYPNTVIYE